MNTTMGMETRLAVRLGMDETGTMLRALQLRFIHRNYWSTHRNYWSIHRNYWAPC